MASLAYWLGMLVLGLLAGFTVMFFMGLFTYMVILPRFKPEWAKTISSYIARFAFKRLPGDGLSAHMDASGLHLKPFKLKDGMIWIDDLPYLSVDEAPVGNALGIPFVATYRNFAGLVNMGLAKVGEEIEKSSYDLRTGGGAVADGGVGMDVDIPERAVVNTSKIQFVDTNAAVPDKAARAVKNAVAAEREEGGISPMKLAMMVIGAFVLGAGIVIITLVIISSLSGSGGGGGAAMALVPLGLRGVADIHG